MAPTMRVAPTPGTRTERKSAVFQELWHDGRYSGAIVGGSSRAYAGTLARPRSKGQISLHPGQFHDWLATLADVAGVPVPARSDGVSLLPTLTGHADQQKPGIVLCRI